MTDGVHDMGGKQGFGPVDVNEPEKPFHHEWEGREWGISQSQAGAPDWTIDWWRHIRELIMPCDYLERPYFDSWAQTDLAGYINSGLISIDEVISGKSAGPPCDAPAALSTAEAISADASHAMRYDVDIDAAPLFGVGENVRARAIGGQYHTRLPQYVRGKPGKIHAHHGAHILPDMNAFGVKQGQHIYSVVFDAADLWPEGKGKRDRVFLDLWESYLEPA